MKVSNTSQRLKEIMNKKGLKQIDILHKIEPLCKKYNIKMGSNDLSQYVTGKVEPSQKKLSVLAEVLDVNEVWLMGYDVPETRNIAKTEDGTILSYDKYYIVPDEMEMLGIKRGSKIKGSDYIRIMNFLPYFYREYEDIVDRLNKMTKKLEKLKVNNELSTEKLVKLVKEFGDYEEKKSKLDENFSNLFNDIKKED